MKSIFHKTNKHMVNHPLTVKNTLLYFARIICTLVVLYLLISIIDTAAVVDSFYNAHYGLMGCAVILGIINIYLQFFKWKLICLNSLNESEEKRIWKSLFYGFAGAVVTPFRIGEYAGRSLGLRNNDIIKTTIGTLTDHFFSLIIILLAGSGAVLIYLRFIGYLSNLAFILLVLIVALLAVTAKWFIMNGGKIKWKLINELKDYKFFRGLINRTENFKGLNVNLRFRLLLFSLLAFLCYTMQYCLLVAALSNEWSFHIYFLIGILTIFTKTIIPPFTLGDLGIRESASVFFVTQYGLPAAIGFNASLLLFFLNIAIPGIIGGILLLKRN